MTVKKLLKLLDDPDVKIKLQSLCLDVIRTKGLGLGVNNEAEVDIKIDDVNQEDEELLKKKDEMLECIETQASKIKELESQIKKCKQSVTNKEDEVSNLLKEAQVRKERLNSVEEKFNLYSKQFKDDIKVEAIYRDLTDQTKESLSGIFKNTSVSGLVACGIQEKNIGNLWEYVKNELVNGSNSDIDKLIQLFDILFSRFSLAFPLYEFQTIAVGDDFDTQLHIKHNSSSNSSGVIEAVLLRGYWNVKTLKVIKQTVVKI